MAEVIIMPKLGFNMDRGQLVAWRRKVGDNVAKGEDLFEINTDKTTMPVQATADGVLLKVMLEEGQSADVFTPIAVVGLAGEDPDAILAERGGGTPVPAAAPAVAVPAPGTPSPAPAAGAVAIGHLELSPKAKKLVLDEGLDPSSLAGIAGTGYRGGITAKDIKASPLAKKAAARAGVDLAGVHGSGAGGRIMRADVERAAAVPAPATADESGKIVKSAVPYAGVRKIIGERLAASKSEAPHLYFTDAVDTAAFALFRADIAERSGVKAAVSDLLIMAASKALQKFPDMNASLVGDTIVSYESTNIGLAVAGSGGLIVPVVKNVQRKSLSVVAAETRGLVERAKAGRLAPDEYSGGTFTISNLGMFDIDNFTAIINPPESAILAVSSVRRKPVAITGADGGDVIAVRPMMNIQLSVDHRVIDGLLAAQFLACLKGLLENPLTILL